MPHRLPSKGDLTEQQMAQQAQDVRHGIKIVNSSSPITLRGLIFGRENKTHEYIKPTGGESSPYRLGDFRNYSNSGGGLVTRTGASSLIGQEIIVNVGGAFDVPAKDVFMTYGGIEPMETDYLLAKQDVYPPDVVHRGIMLTYQGVSYYQTGVVNWNNSTLKAWLPQGTNNISVEAMQFMTNIAQPTLRNATNIPAGAHFYAVLKDASEGYSDNPYPIFVKKILAPGTLRYKEPPFLRAEYSELNNRVDFEVRFDASVAEAGGGFLDDITAVLFRRSDGVWLELKGVGDYPLANGEIKAFFGSFTSTAAQNPVGLMVKIIERQNDRVQSAILMKS